MAKRLYTAEEACAILQYCDSSEEDLSDSDEEWCPQEDSDSLSESDTDSDSAGPPPAQPARTEVQARGTDPDPMNSDTDSAAEGGSPHPDEMTAPSAATTSNASQRGQRAARPSQRQELPYELRHPQWAPSNLEAPSIHPFTASSGIQVATENMQPLDFLSLFITDTFLQFVCEQTNLYAQQKIAANPTSSFVGKWNPTNVPELKFFLGLTLNMGITKKPEQNRYWSKDSIHYMPIYSAAMPRHRYELIMSCLHFNDNANNLSHDDPDRDRLFKIRPLIDHLNQKFGELYIPNQKIAIDESLVPFHGRLGIKQYIPSKRSRYGVKLYKLCESGTGFTYTFRVYEGKDSVIEPPGCPPYMGAGERIVLDLINPLLHQGYQLYVDNFYSSVPLFKFLHTAQTGACGTVRANRKGLPPQVLNKKLKRGECYSNRNDELLALKYRDKRDVLLLTNIHSEATTSVTSRRQEVTKPVAIAEYNKHMGGVDLADQMLAPYRIDRKRRAWYKKVSIYLMQVALHNSFVIYKRSSSRNKARFLKFQEQVIRTLIHRSVQPEKNPVQLVSEDVTRLHERHFPAVLQENAYFIEAISPKEM
ncbi:piggyBac transposable element-derived protein 4-like [Hyperolius riggenbachi]|uniref:piggyBac transposable element-derived protein 4-like n=1 Tax=Hyperolius riggenbachi TaxID=752182 RepID=UPI0035A2C26A